MKRQFNERFFEEMKGQGVTYKELAGRVHFSKAKVWNDVHKKCEEGQARKIVEMGIRKANWEDYLIPVRDGGGAPKIYSWEEVQAGAEKVRDYVLGVFHANLIVTTQGFSALFANLVLGLVDKEVRRNLPLVVCLAYNWSKSTASPAPPAFSGYDTISEGGVAISFPKVLKELINESPPRNRIAFVDDVIVTGAVPAIVRPYLEQVIAGKPEAAAPGGVMFGCFAFIEAVGQIYPARRPEFSAETHKSPNDFELLWPKEWYGR